MLTLRLCVLIQLLRNIFHVDLIAVRIVLANISANIFFRKVRQILEYECEHKRDLISVNRNRGYVSFAEETKNVCVWLPAGHLHAEYTRQPDLVLASC